MMVGFLLVVADGLSSSSSSSSSVPAAPKPGGRRRMAPQPSPSSPSPAEGAPRVKQHYCLRTADGATSVVSGLGCCAVETKLPKELTEVSGE